MIIFAILFRCIQEYKYRLSDYLIYLEFIHLILDFFYIEYHNHSFEHIIILFIYLNSLHLRRTRLGTVNIIIMLKKDSYLHLDIWVTSEC